MKVEIFHEWIKNINDELQNASLSNARRKKLIRKRNRFMDLIRQNSENNRSR